ncbi:hypothetical protein GW17_00047361 [Ensete ventricosum]|nr:hypothetical protein GW17_00047361 [Ensete ventricosum]
MSRVFPPLPSPRSAEVAAPPPLSTRPPLPGPAPTLRTQPAPFPPGPPHRHPFPPLSPAKHIKAALAKRLGSEKPKEGSVPEAVTGEAEQPPLDKSFGYGKNFGSKYELGKDVGRGHFGNTCLATAKKGEIKGQTVAVKIIAKAKVRWHDVL